SFNSPLTPLPGLNIRSFTPPTSPTGFPSWPLTVPAERWTSLIPTQAPVRAASIASEPGPSLELRGGRRLIALGRLIRNPPGKSEALHWSAPGRGSWTESARGHRPPRRAGPRQGLCRQGRLLRLGRLQRRPETTEPGFPWLSWLPSRD